MFGIKKKEKKSISTTILFSTLEEMNEKMVNELNGKLEKCYNNSNLKYEPVVIQNK